MDKDNLVCIRTMEYYLVIKKRNSSVCDNMDETGRHTKWNKSVAEGVILYDFTLWCTYNSQILELILKNEEMVARGWSWGEMGIC